MTLLDPWLVEIYTRMAQLGVNLKWLQNSQLFDGNLTACTALNSDASCYEALQRIYSALRMYD